MTPIHILLVEDNPADVELTQESLSMANPHLRRAAVHDGAQALAWLYRQDSYQDVPRPDLILLDLNLPRRDGREVLAVLKRDPQLRRIPIVILTSSEAERDVVQSYDLGANCYLVKPVDLKSFEILVQLVEDFWLTVVKLPPGDAGMGK